MRLFENKIFKSLSFKTAISVILLNLLIGTAFYIFVLRSIASFANVHIQDTINNVSKDIYNICDHNLNELINTSGLGNEQAVRIKKAYTLGQIDDYLRQNRLEGAVISEGRALLSGSIPFELMQKTKETTLESSVSALTYNNKKYYFFHSEFGPWKWHILLAIDANDISILVENVKRAYILTAIILFFATLLLILNLNRYLKNPIDNIIMKLKNGERPEYKGIAEFEYLSSSINTTMLSLQEETRMLNYVYQIVVSKRSSEFFDEVTTAITMLFGLDSLIARINPEGKSEHVISMFVNGIIKKGMDIPITGTPCENVIERKHLCVYGTGAWREFPGAIILQETKAESFIGSAIFDRKGNVIGVVNAFGRQRDFSESDIKVFQTIGELISSEFERIDEEKEKESMREQLFQSQKMESIGTLAGGVAHDFNNMLQGILGYTSLIKMNTPSDSPIYKPLEIIEQTSIRAAELTKQLLGFARKGKVIIEPLNLNEIVNDTLNIISRIFDKSIEIRTAIQDNIWTIEGDRSQLQQVILNLCLNARDAMPHGGVLTINTSNEILNVEEFQEAKEGTGKYVVLSITDTGTGVDEKIRDRIFEPFFTTKDIGKGTGMGLAMVYGVVKNHDGFVRFQSKTGKGSSFVIYLQATHKQQAKIEPGIRELFKGSGTILVIDDEKVIRNFTKAVLERLGYDVLDADNGREGVEIYKKWNNKIKLVILDMIMPKMGGRETFGLLKEINPEAKILISSGFGMDEQIKKILETGAVGFIQKPYDIIEFAESIKKAAS